ncbi:two-component system sensor histidine kinase DegS [Natranaerovirga hydrolytica]|uniref:Oxygen sensor histidine kinase NreB n=1 Tax=Natranaerovirga hydrolytica TaxID=680378 RepID=A0A4V2PYP8_9FIRM|nr:sensor histidine kinase [Natranaerovirga hydrolytica]TCK86781.1 two-component system sensor histidine kinase DegS [Natranaerovirga hydrolytica]
MITKEIHKLDYIINNISLSIRNSIDEVNEMYKSSKITYKELEKEFYRLKNEATNVNKNVKLIEDKLEFVLNKANKNNGVNYEGILDELRVILALEKEKEWNLIQRRTVVENHIKLIRDINSKAEGLEKTFELADNLLTGNLRDITDSTDKIQFNETFGIKILQAQENERQRIAREMHDGPAQSLTNLIHIIELCIKLIDRDPVRTRLELQSLKNVIRNTIDDTRRIIYDLRPMSLDDLGLSVTIERYIERIKENNDFEIKFEVVNDEYDVKQIINLTLFRIIQESLNNITKYAKASMVNIVITYNEDSIEVLIEDNGIGFDINKSVCNADISKGFGLSMMKERVYLLSGEIDIKSQINKGTKFYIKVPILEEDE